MVVHLFDPRREKDLRAEKKKQNCALGTNAIKEMEAVARNPERPLSIVPEIAQIEMLVGAIKISSVCTH